ncbi:MAG: hypothetical protein J6A94_02225 [Lachnospiraceae bacterium]|nr:hypothetical protein [Lachnospiraceae bacterium]
MKKKVLTWCAVVGLSLSLLGCGENDYTGDVIYSNVSENKKIEQNMDGKTDSETDDKNETAESLALSEILYGNEVSVWYDCDRIDKVAIPDVYVMYGDGTYMKDSEYTFGELSKMTDKEIIAWAENSFEERNAGICVYCYTHSEEMKELLNSFGYEEYMAETIINIVGADKRLVAINPDYAETAEAGAELLREEIAKRIAEEGTPKYRYGISVETDASGNSVQKEKIYFEEKQYYYNENGEAIQIVQPDRSWGEEALVGDVYESTYSGWRQSCGNYFLQRIESQDMVYQLDEVGTEGILVDEEVQFD